MRFVAHVRTTCRNIKSEQLDHSEGVGADGPAFSASVGHGLERVTVSVTGLVTPFGQIAGSTLTGLSPLEDHLGWI